MSTFVELSLPVNAVPPEGRLLEKFDVTVEIDRVVPTGSVAHHAWIVGPDAERAVAALADDPTVDVRTVAEEDSERALVHVRWLRDEPVLFDLVESSDAMLVEAVGTRDEWSLTLRFADQRTLSAFYDACREHELTVELRGISTEETPDADYGLTRAQRETLFAAFRDGYFDIPRATTLGDIGERLGVSEQAVSERLRRALAALLDRSLPEDAADEE